MRSGPGTKYPVIKSYPKGTEVKIIGKNQHGTWVKVLAPDGNEGWMATEYLIMNHINMYDVNVIESPPTPSPLIVEQFGRYDTSSLRATYFINNAWGANEVSIRVDASGVAKYMALDYRINAAPPNDYIMVGRCFSPSLDWSGYQAIEISVTNDQSPKTFVFQFGEEQPCGKEYFPGEVWRVFIHLSPNETRILRIPFSNFHHADWSPAKNGRIDLNQISYLAFGLQDAGTISGTLLVGNVKAVR